MPILEIGVLSMHLPWWHRLLNFSRSPPPPPPPLPSVDFSSQSWRTVPGIPPRREAGYGWARGDWSQNIVYWVLQMYLGGGGVGGQAYTTQHLPFRSALWSHKSACVFFPELGPLVHSRFNLFFFRFLQTKSDSAGRRMGIVKSCCAL
jgi:hypothetical protein